MALLLPGFAFRWTLRFFLREAERKLPVLLKNKNGGEPFTVFGRAFFDARRLAGYQQLYILKGQFSSGNLFPDRERTGRGLFVSGAIIVFLPLPHEVPAERTAAGGFLLIVFPFTLFDAGPQICNDRFLALPALWWKMMNLGQNMDFGINFVS
jgi:hypothetical protein